MVDLGKSGSKSPPFHQYTKSQPISVQYLGLNKEVIANYLETLTILVRIDNTTINIGENRQYHHGIFYFCDTQVAARFLMIGELIKEIGELIKEIHEDFKKITRMLIQLSQRFIIREIAPRTEEEVYSG